MHISASVQPMRNASAPLPTSSMPTSPVAAVASDIKGFVPSRIDFSRISPRQLEAWLDDMMMNGTPEDFQTAHDISIMLPSDWSEDDDTPMNLTVDIEGARDWNRTYGEARFADRLDSLLGRMKAVELRSIRIAETA